MRRDGRRRGQAGFTMIELMVSLVLVSIVVGLLMNIAVSILTGFKTQRESMELSRNARAGIEMLAEAVRNASAGVITGDLRDATSCNTVVGITVTNASDAPDAIELIYAAGGKVTSSRMLVDDSTTQITVVEGSALAAGDSIIVTDGTQGRLLPVTSVAPSGNVTVLGTRTNNCPSVTMPDGGFAPGSLVVRARYARLAVETGSDGVPMLTVDPDGNGTLPSEILAEGVEDLQIAVGVDLDGDGGLLDTASTTDEWFYNAPGDAAPPPITSGDWRALRITVTARDLRRKGASARPAAEDRDAGATDQHRRRTLSTQIEIRNLGKAL
jgi:prepilin-type N-terminal cleavage/methylation domain-containing protein